MPAGDPDQDSTTLADVVHIDAPGGEGALRKRRLLYAVTSAVLALIMVLAVVDGLGVADVYGVDTASVSAEGGGYRLEVRYPTVSRPGLASPFEIVVERPGGFAEPVEVGVDLQYLGLWDSNGQYPTPTSETTADGWVLWEFDPPEGEALTFQFDGRIEAGAQRGGAGRVAVMEGGAPVVQVSFSTRVRP